MNTKRLQIADTNDHTYSLHLITALEISSAYNACWQSKSCVISRMTSGILLQAFKSTMSWRYVIKPPGFELCPSVSSCRLKLYLKRHCFRRMFLFSLALLSNSISEVLHQLSHVSALWLTHLHPVSLLKILSIRTYVSCVELWKKPHTPHLKRSSFSRCGSLFSLQSDLKGSTQKSYSANHVSSVQINSILC